MSFSSDLPKTTEGVSVKLGRAPLPKEEEKESLEKPSKSPLPKSLEASNQRSNRIRDD